MYEQIQFAIQSTKTLIGLIKAIHGVSNQVELLTIVNTIQEKLSQALILNQESAEVQAALRDRISNLEKKINEFENWERQMERYVLFKFPTGTYAYSVKAGMDEGEPPHYLCATSINRRQKGILQPRGDSFSCPICKTTIETHLSKPAKTGSRKWI